MIINVSEMKKLIALLTTLLITGSLLIGGQVVYADSHNATIPASVNDQIQSDYDEAISECVGSEIVECMGDAYDAREQALEDAQEIANRNRNNPECPEGNNQCIANNAANGECEGLTGAAYETCYNDAVRDSLNAQEAEARAEAEAAAAAGEDTPLGTEPIPTEEVIIDNINDSSSFNVGQILTTSDQDQKYLVDAEGNPIEQPIMALILDAINTISRIIGSIAMILIIIGGLLMIASEGEEDRIQKGKEMIKAAIIGLIISMAAFLIITFFQSIFYT